MYAKIGVVWSMEIFIANYMVSKSGLKRLDNGMKFAKKYKSEVQEVLKFS